MTGFALIHQQRVSDVVARELDCFPVHDAMRWVACPDGVEPGDSWDEQTGAFFSARAALAAAISARPRRATAKQLRYALNARGERAAWDTALASVSADTRDYWHVEPDPPESSAKLRRIAARAGVDLVALYDQALTL